MNRTGVTYPKGFSAAGVACGLKQNGNRDLAVVVSEVPAVVAGVFTTNLVKGHSLQWSRRNIAGGLARAVAINSGCANACLGSDGDHAAEAFAGMVAARADCPVGQAFIGSTGVIGVPLNLQKIEQGLNEAFGQLSAEGGLSAAEAVMTTDTFAKQAQASFTLGSSEIRIGGFAKGSGMIHPNMATMISVLTTDIAITAPLLDKALRAAVSKSYNRISVDGDTSVCDKVLLLANGTAANTPISEENEDFRRFVDTLTQVAVNLARMLARDGEGATKLLEFAVHGAPDTDTAHRMLETICKSPLVKTAFFGEDANWGRILTAAGYSGACFDPEKVDIRLGDVIVCQNGTGLPFDEAAALEVLRHDEIVISIDLKSGPATERMWTCDLSYDYVKINGSYRS